MSSKAHSSFVWKKMDFSCVHFMFLFILVCFIFVLCLWISFRNDFWCWRLSLLLARMSLYISIFFLFMQLWPQVWNISPVTKCSHFLLRFQLWILSDSGSHISMGREKLRKQRSGRLIETLKMERVRTILTHRYPYPHEHSRHLMIAVFAIWLFFVSSDNLQTLIMKLDKNFKWWSMYACLIGFFYFFSSPFIRKTIKPSYSNFSRW